MKKLIVLFVLSAVVGCTTACGGKKDNNSGSIGLDTVGNNTASDTSDQNVDISDSSTTASGSDTTSQATFRDIYMLEGTYWGDDFEAVVKETGITITSYGVEYFLDPATAKLDYNTGYYHAYYNGMAATFHQVSGSSDIEYIDFWPGTGNDSDTRYDIMITSQE